MNTTQTHYSYITKALTGNEVPALIAEFIKEGPPHMLLYFARKLLSLTCPKFLSVRRFQTRFPLLKHLNDLMRRARAKPDDQACENNPVVKS